MGGARRYLGDISSGSDTVDLVEGAVIVIVLVLLLLFRLAVETVIVLILVILGGSP